MIAGTVLGVERRAEEIDLQIYYFETPNPRKLCAMARHLDLLVGSGGWGFQLWESHAVMIYLAQKAGSDLWSSDPARQVEVNK